MSYFIPLRVLLADLFGDEDAAAADLLAPADGRSILDEVGIDTFAIRATADRTELHLVLSFRDELVLAAPGLEGLALVFGGTGDRSELSLEITLHPAFALRLVDLDVALRVANDVLRRVRRGSDGWVPDEADGRPRPLEIRLEGITLSAGIETGFDVTFPGGAPALTVAPFMIGDSGIVIEADRPIRLFLSDEATPMDGVPPDFRGIAFESIRVHLPDNINVPLLPEALTFEGVTIGSGGFGGTVRGVFSIEFDEAAKRFRGTGAGDLFGLPFALRSLSLSFRQNVPVASSLESELYLDFLRQRIGLALSLGLDGSFSAALVPASSGGAGGASGAILRFTQEGLLSLAVESLGFEADSDQMVVAMSGRVRPLLAGLDWPEFELRRLAIDSNGDVEIDGGWMDIPESVTLDFHGFKIDITEFGIGTEGEGEDRRHWLGVSGGISLVEGIPLSASVDGLKFTWDPDDPSDLEVSLRGVGLRLEIPNTLRLEGSVSYTELGEDEGGPTGLTGHLFVGHARLDLYALRTEVSAELLIGNVTDTTTGQSFTAFFIVLSADLPTAIPLGASGAALYAIKGLFGMHVAPDRQLVDGEVEPWYRWYREARGGVEGSAYSVIPVVKWQPRFDHYAFGAGLTLGTQFDDGFSINAGALVAILIPGPVVMIEGKANLLKQRGSSGRDAEGALYLLAVFDGLASTFQLNVDVQYDLEDVIEIGGGLEAFFDFNDSSNWYVHIGKKEPEDKRIRAKVLSIITANAYLMIEPRGIQTGAWAGVVFDESFGPVRLVLKAFFAFDAGIWWKEPQFEGQIQLYAEVGLTIVGIGIGLILETLLAGKAPQPYWIYGKARVAINLPFPLPSFDVDVEFEWGEADRPYSVEYLKRADLIHHKLIGASWAMAADEASAPVVPVDATPVLSFAKPLWGLSVRRREDGATESHFADHVTDWEFTYRPPALELHVREDDGTWTLLKQSPLRVGDISRVTPFDIRAENLLPDVYAQEPQLLLWRYGPLHTANRPAREDYEPYCPTQAPAPLTCVDWSEVPSGTVYPLEFRHAGIAFAVPLEAQHHPPRVEHSALNTPTISLRFPEPLHYIEIRYRVALDPRRRITVQAAAYSQGKHAADLVVQAMSATEFRLSLPDGGFNWAIDLVRLRVSSTSIGFPFPGSGTVDPGGGTEPEAAHARIDIVTVCYQTTADVLLRDLTDPASLDESGDFLYRGLELEPNRMYRLTVQTTRTERQLASNSGETPIQDTATFYFRTGNVPGAMYASDPPDYAETPLNDIATYIAETIPRHGARTHYHHYDVALTFNEAYARGFYRNIELGIRDRNGRSIGAATTGEFTGWLPLLSDGLVTYLLGLEEYPCEHAPQPPVQRRVYVYRSTDGLLAPRRMYTVEVRAPAETGDRVLYSFQFTTSRFATAEAHLASGLRDEEQVVHTLPPGPAPATVRFGERATLEDSVQAKREALRELVARSGGVPTLEIAATLAELETAIGELERLDAELFDEIDAGVQPRFEALGMGRRTLPPVLELIRVPTAGTGRSFLLLESPEPLDRRRLTIELVDGGPVLHAIWNRDQTRAYIFPRDADGFEAGAYRFRIRHSGGGPDRPDLVPLTRDGEVVNAEVTLAVEI